MSQAPPQKTKPIVWIGLIGACAIIYLVAVPPDSTKSEKSTKKPIPEAKAPVGFTKEDYTVTFPPVNSATRNAFMPVVMRQDRNGTAQAAPNALSAGGGNWIFTGTVELNGVKQALLENPATGEGAFLRLGESWNGYSVVTIRDDQVTVTSPTGQSKTIKLEGEVVPAPNNAPSNAPLTLNNPLSGPIGGNFGVRALDNPAPAAEAAPTEGRRRRNRNNAN
jgi:hypothetical protein